MDLNLPPVALSRFEGRLPEPEPVISPTQEVREGTSPCPVPFAHDRIIEAHYFWHAAAVKYHDPDVFRFQLSALLQSMVGTRNMLLKDTEDDEAANEWVRSAIETARDASDAVKWTIETRNSLVHESRLLQTSRVEYGIYRWFGHLKMAVGSAADPFVPTHRIVEELLQKLEVDEGLYDLGIMTPHEDQYFGITRLWLLSSDGSDMELLSSTAEALQWLRGIVGHIHEAGPTGVAVPHVLECETNMIQYQHVPLLYHED